MMEVFRKMADKMVAARHANAVQMMKKRRAGHVINDSWAYVDAIRPGKS